MSYQLLDNFNQGVELLIQPLYSVEKNWLQGLLHLLIILYATRFAPSLPKPVQDLVSNQYFQLLVFFLILVLANQKPATALLIGLAFLLTMNYINTGKFLERMENTDLKNEIVKTPEQVDLTEAPVQVTGEVTLPPVIITPTIVTTESGEQVVATPTVLVAPKTVMNDQAQEVTITPDVQVLEMTTTSAPETTTAAPAALMTLAPETTTAAPVETPAPTMATEAPAQAQLAACFPIRQYDMTKVGAFDGDLYSEL